MPEEVMEIHVIVKGHVQGVGFRFYAERAAVKSGLTGWVKNLSNGDVETVAQGSKQSLDSYIDWLKQGPSTARVIDISIQWREITQFYNSFSLTY